MVKNSIVLMTMFLNTQVMATDVLEKEITFHYANPTKVTFKGNDLSADQHHKFETPVGSLRVNIFFRRDHSIDLLYSFALDPNEKRKVDISQILSPLSLVGSDPSGLYVAAGLVAKDEKIAVGSPSSASCSDIKLGSTITFSLKNLGNNQYALGSQETSL